MAENFSRNKMAKIASLRMRAADLTPSCASADAERIQKRKRYENYRFCLTLQLVEYDISRLLSKNFPAC